MDHHTGPVRGANNNSTCLQGVNNVSDGDTSPNTAVHIAMMAEIYCMPVICSFGIIGNTLSAITFFRNPLRKTSCNIYLGVRCISDNGFLLSLLLIWISGVFDLRLSSVTGVCQAVVFLTYICGCVSIWLVVFVTGETYIRICHPFFMKSVCAKRPARILTATLCICSFGIYNFPLWISNADCSHSRKYFELTQALVYTDTLLTLVIPSILITILMFGIFFGLIQAYRRRQSRNRSPGTKTRQKRDSLPAAKVTKMLLIVSLIYFILNIPSHIIRLEILINSFIKGQVQSSDVERALQTSFQLLYYISFSVSIIIYLKFGRNFRNTFRKTFCKVQKTGNKDNLCEAINMVPRSQGKNRRSVTVIIGSKPTYYLTLPSADMSTQCSEARSQLHSCQQQQQN